MMRRTLEYLLWLIALLPACLIYTENTADWGDDWAAYFAEAQNICNSHPVDKTHYRFFNYNDHYAPAAYPVGYPLLLAPAVARNGMNMAKLGLYMSIWTALWLALSAYMLNRRFEWKTALCGIAIFLLTPYILETKGRLWSDIPFSLFLLAALCLYDYRYRLRYALAAGLCIGIAVTIRSIGIVILVAIVVDTLLSVLSKDSTSRIGRALPLAWIGIAAAAPILFTKLLYPIADNDYYLHQFSTANLDSIATNMRTYFMCFTTFLTNDSCDFMIYKYMLSTVILILLLTGMMIERKRRVWIIVLTLMLIVVFVFPDTQDMRYLIPMLPVAAYFVLACCEHLFRNAVRYRSIAGLLLLISISALRYDLYMGLWAKCGLPHTYGPFTQTSILGLREIQQRIPPDKLLLCRWPRVVGLLTDRDCCVIPGPDISHQLQSLKTSHPDFLLSVDERDAEMTDLIAQEHRDSMIYRGYGFTLYQCRSWR